MTLYIGIDIGCSGGIVSITDKGIISLDVMPMIGREYNVKELLSILDTITSYKDDNKIIGIEMPIAMPRHSSQGTLKTGMGYGLILGCVASKGLPYCTVRPNEWTKTIHRGLPAKLKAKDKSRIIVQRLYPNLDLRANARCKVIHEGLMDALLIATYLKETK
jgi:hypothetical protein